MASLDTAAGRCLHHPTTTLVRIPAQTQSLRFSLLGVSSSAALYSSFPCRLRSLVGNWKHGWLVIRTTASGEAMSVEAHPSHRGMETGQALPNIDTKVAFCGAGSSIPVASVVSPRLHGSVTNSFQPSPPFGATCPISASSNHLKLDAPEESGGSLCKTQVDQGYSTPLCFHGRLHVKTKR